MAAPVTISALASDRPGLSHRAVILSLLSLQAIALLLVGAHVLVTELIYGTSFDIIHYYQVATAMLMGEAPYRDIPLEYPPLAVVPFLLPRLVFGGSQAGFGGYLWAFLAQSVLLSSLTAAVVVRTAARWRFSLNSETALTVYAGLVFVGSYLLPWRYDIFPALLTALALYCLLAGRSLAAGGWLGLGIAAKIYPIVLVPIFALYLLSQGRKRDFGLFGLACGGAVALCFLPFLLLAPHSVFSFLRYHELRGLEIGSVGSGVILLARHFGLTSAQVVFNFGAFHLVSPWAHPIIACLPAGFLILFGLLLLKCGRVFRQEWRANGSVTPDSLARFATAALLLFIVANKVFSPQYLVWLLPFAPLLRPREAIGVVAVSVLTTLLYPFLFAHLVGMETSDVLLLNTRNLLVALVLGSLLLQRKNTHACV